MKVQVLAYAIFVSFPNISYPGLTLYPIETHFSAFANRADPGQTALVRAAWSGSTLFAYEKYDKTDPDT